MYGVYINCGKYPFIDWILSGEKRFETRTRNTLKSIVGETVALIETGNGIPLIRGVATIKSFRTVAYDDVEMRKMARIAGTEYDIKPGQTKVFYTLADVREVTPQRVPINRKNHGRTYTEIEETELIEGA